MDQLRHYFLLTPGGLGHFDPVLPIRCLIRLQNVNRKVSVMGFLQKTLQKYVKTLAQLG